MIPAHDLAGHRKAWALTMVGVFHLGYAGTTLWDHTDLDPARAVLYELLPTWLRVTLWVACGALAITLARTRWSQIGWGAVMVMPLERLVSHAWSGLMFLTPGWPPGMVASGSYILRWLALAALIRLISSWPEPETTVTPPRDGGR